MNDLQRFYTLALVLTSGFLVYVLAPVLMPFIAAAILAYVADPLVDKLEKYKLGRTLAASIVFITMSSLGILLLLFLLGIWVCEKVSHKLGVHDHGGIVWDEMVGYWLSMAFVPLQWQWLLAAFVLFRFFDIVKPWPIRQLDQRVSGGFGIMIDDIVAALFTIIILAVLQYLW